MAIITIKEINVQTIKKGRNSYEQADVQYIDAKGETKSKKIVSFANPAVLDAVKGAKEGEQFNVTNKEVDGYWQWVSIEPVAQSPKATGSGVKGGTYVDTRETPEERAKRQLMIVRQSCLGYAIEFAKLEMSSEGAEPWTPGDIVEQAQQFVDFVYGNDEALEEVDTDIPY